MNGKVSKLKKIKFLRNKTWTSFLQALFFFRVDDIRKVYNNLLPESKPHFWSTFSSHLVAIVTAWMGFSIGYLVYDNSKQENQRLVHYQIINQIKPFYDEYNDSCGEYSSYLFALVSKLSGESEKKDELSSQERIARILESDTLHVFTDTVYVNDIVKMGRASVKIFDNAKLYITKDGIERSLVEHNNMKIALGVDIVKSMISNDSTMFSKENVKYRNKLSPYSIVSIHHNKYDSNHLIDSLRSNYIYIQAQIDSLVKSNQQMQLAIDELNQIRGVSEPPLNENSCITNVNPGNRISDTIYNRKLDLLNSYKLISAYKNQLDNDRASIIISEIMTPSLINWQYIENALDTDKGTNPVRTVLAILFGTLLLGYILFRFIVIRFFKL